MVPGEGSVPNVCLSDLSGWLLLREKMADGEDSFGLGCQSARAEALGLYRMVGHDGNTVEQLRALIAVPARTERVLCAFARAHPEEAYFIEKCIKFRQAVALEFETLLREGVPVAELPEAEESELDALEETFANAAP